MVQRKTPYETTLLPGVCAVPVYVIQEEGTQFVKIGYTSADSPDGRRKTLQTGNPRSLVVRTLFPRRGRGFEKKLHGYLQPFRCEGGSEWFDLPHHVLDALLQRKWKTIKVYAQDFERNRISGSKQGTLGSYAEDVRQERRLRKVEAEKRYKQALNEAGVSVNWVYEHHVELYNLWRALTGKLSPVCGTIEQRVRALLNNTSSDFYWHDYALRLFGFDESIPSDEHDQAQMDYTFPFNTISDEYSLLPFPGRELPVQAWKRLERLERWTRSAAETHIVAHMLDHPTGSPLCEMRWEWEFDVKGMDQEIPDRYIMWQFRHLMDLPQIRRKFPAGGCVVPWPEKWPPPTPEMRAFSWAEPSPQQALCPA